MAIVGNGFDIQALSDLGSPADTRYESFYHYLKYRKFDPNNTILQKMEELRTQDKGNWSDIENALSTLTDEDGIQTSLVIEDLGRIQREFSAFLDGVATPEILSRLGDRAVKHALTIHSFTEFLGDIDDPEEYSKMKLPARLDIGDLFNFRFINFNYTALLDDYVYLDQEQFDPHPYKGSDRNTDFHPNPRGHIKARERQDFSMVSYLISDVIHPHGIQSIPRSLLFGIDSADGNSRDLAKPYWAQNDTKYSGLFLETDLFIIFGSSLGETDGWWWRSIANALETEADSELILYWRRGQYETELSSQTVRERFAYAAERGESLEFLEILNEKARIVIYEDHTPRAWLNTNPDNVPCWVLSK